MKHITFCPLNADYFPLLLKWLEAPHVKKWWDSDITYDIALVRKKFNQHIHKMPISYAANMLIYAYIINADGRAIGYIQTYNARCWAQKNGIDVQLLPEQTAGIDLFIGEAEFVNKGLGSQVIENFWQQILQKHFAACVVDPASNNHQAIKACIKAGFAIMAKMQTKEVTWMIKNKHVDITKYEFFNKLKCLQFIEKIILFGSRARQDNAPRADIDLAILCPQATRQEWQQILDIIEDADTLLKIDCIRLDEIDANSPFMTNINKDGVIIYAKTGEQI